MKLVLPEMKYKASYLEMVEEIKREGEDFVPFPLRFDTTDFKSFLRRLDAYRNELGLKEGFVPHTTFWLISDGKVVACSNLRHYLNEHLEKVGGHIGYGVRPSSRNKGFAKKLLELTLLEGQKLGIKKFYLTCTKDNIASEKTIMANNGIFAGEFWDEEEKRTIKQFWIHR